MMKLGWLVKRSKYDDDFEFKLDEPDSYRYEIIIPIVYAEISKKLPGED